MKFVFVNYLMGMHRGGGENYDLNITSALSDQGHEIVFYYLRPVFKNYLYSHPRYSSGYSVRAPWLYFWTQYLYRVAIVRKIKYVRGMPRFISQITFEIGAFLKIYLNEKKPVIIHACGLGVLGLLLTWTTKHKVYVRYPGPPRNAAIDIFILNKLPNIIANGDAHRQIQNLAPRANLFYLNVGLGDIFKQQLPTRQSGRKKCNLNDESIYFLFVGRIERIKNVGLLIEASVPLMKKNKRVELIIIGDGSDKALLQKIALANSIADKVHFLGNKSKSDLIYYYSACDYFVLPSLYDNFPNVIIESMAAGLPVLASKVGGIPLMIEDGHDGLLFESENINDLTEKMFFLIDNVRFSQKLSINGKAKVQVDYSWYETAKKFVNISEGNII